MGMETLQLEISDGVAEIRLNRPDQRNAMNPAFWREIRSVFEGLDQNPDARVAVITSTGPHFSAGLDLKSFGSLMEPGSSGEEGRRR